MRQDDLPFDFVSDEAVRTRGCDRPGCQAEGTCRAPVSRFRLDEYYWFCPEHAAEYNRAWNWCEGMSETEIEAQLRRDTCWDRPSWPMGQWQNKMGQLYRRLHEQFLDEDPEAAAERERAREREQRNRQAANGHVDEVVRALTVLGLEPPVEPEKIKATWKNLVKLYHPDANGGDKQAEEKLKDINHAYAVLRNAWSSLPAKQ